MVRRIEVFDPQEEANAARELLPNPENLAFAIRAGIADHIWSCLANSINQFSAQKVWTEGTGKYTITNMSQILVLNPPFNGLTAIANVVNRVGPAEIDNPNDVKVVQTLIRMLKSNFAKKVGLPPVTGNFDAATGFWIYDTQQYLKSKGGHSNLVVDGIVSPAHGAVYASGAPWTIVLFNLYAKRDSPAEYAAFLSQVGASR